MHLVSSDQQKKDIITILNNLKGPNLNLDPAVINSIVNRVQKTLRENPGASLQGEVEKRWSEIAKANPQYVKSSSSTGLQAVPIRNTPTPDTTAKGHTNYGFTVSESQESKRKKKQI